MGFCGGVVTRWNDWNSVMQTPIRIAVCVALLMVIARPALAMGFRPSNPSPSQLLRGAPGPIAGAGLPILAVGYGVYWFVRRRKPR